MRLEISGRHLGTSGNEISKHYIFSNFSPQLKLFKCLCRYLVLVPYNL